MENVSLFLPIINILQEKSLDRKLNFEIDLQNNELYILQELTRCSALLNYIHFNGKNIFNDTKSRVNVVFDTFLQIPDPIHTFINNFEHFFAMYIHSKYGKNNFKLYMKECEKSPVAYPISVFEDGLCIFMQYNTCELRKYIYNIITMFYYYTGQNFYEMIRPNLNRIPRPNVYDDYDDVNDGGISTNKCNKSNINTSEQKRMKNRDEKLCFLNHRNYNIKRPYFVRNNQTQVDSLSINSHFEKCILTTDGINYKKQYPEVIVGNKNKQRPIISIDLEAVQDINIVPASQCNKSGLNQSRKIYQFSDHLNRSRNFETDTINNDMDTRSLEYNRFDNRKQFDRKAFIQTNFSTIWACDNRRQLVSLNIIYSIMNICIQKITQSLLESRNRQYKCDKKFTCIQNENTIEYDSNDDDDEDISSNRKNDNDDSKMKKFIKLKKPTIEISFKRNTSTNTNTLRSETLKFSV